MRALSASELLTVWERGLTAQPFERALTLLSAGFPESPPALLARLSIGRRDAHLLQLREWAFGSELTMLAECPGCHQMLESTVPLAKLRMSADSSGYPSETPTESSPGSVEACLTLRGYVVRYRPPNTEDVAGCIGLQPAESGRRLLAFCLTDARFQDQELSAEDLPEDVVAEVTQRIAAIDPQADTHLDFVCPDCHQRWNEVFDIVSFFWTEIDAWARRILREIDLLARAYGWRESDTLALSPVRRQIYLAMAQA